MNKKRHESNKRIIQIIESFLEENQDLRFKQALIDLGIIKDSHNDFNEESVTTLKKLNKETGIPNVSCKEKPQLFVCRCSSYEHNLIIDCQDKDVFVEIHLAPLSFWSRLKNGVKYILGYRCKYGDFEEIIFDPEDTDRLQDIVDYLRTLK